MDKKPVVPQFVADWYDDNQDDFEFNLYRLCIDYDNCELDKEMMIWFRDKNNNPIQTLTAMHQLGYEVEKEKLYRAKNRMRIVISIILVLLIKCLKGE